MNFKNDDFNNFRRNTFGSLQKPTILNLPKVDELEQAEYRQRNQNRDQNKIFNGASKENEMKLIEAKTNQPISKDPSKQYIGMYEHRR